MVIIGIVMIGIPAQYSPQGSGQLAALVKRVGGGIPCISEAAHCTGDEPAATERNRPAER